MHILILFVQLSFLVVVYKNVSSWWIGKRETGSSPQIVWEALLWEEGPLPGPERGILSNPQKWIVQGDTRADKGRGFIGKGCPSGEQEGEGTWEDCAARGSQSWAYGDGLASGCLWQSFWLRVLPGGAHTAQPRWMPERRILGGGRTRGDSFWLFPDSSIWWWLVSSMFLTKTYCRKTTHANGYWGAWLGWAVLVRVFLLTAENSVWKECKYVCVCRVKVLGRKTLLFSSRFFWLV